MHLFSRSYFSSFVVSASNVAARSIEWYLDGWFVGWFCDVFYFSGKRVFGDYIASATRISFNCQQAIRTNTEHAFSKESVVVVDVVIIILIDGCRYLSNAHLNAYVYLFILYFFIILLVIFNFEWVFTYLQMRCVHNYTPHIRGELFFIAFDLFKLHLNTLSIQRVQEREKGKMKRPVDTFNNAIWCLFLLSCCHLTSLFCLWYLYILLYMLVFMYFPLENVSFMFLFERDEEWEVFFSFTPRASDRISVYRPAHVYYTSHKPFSKCEHCKWQWFTHTTCHIKSYCCYTVSFFVVLC